MKSKCDIIKIDYFNMNLSKYYNVKLIKLRMDIDFDILNGGHNFSRFISNINK